MSITNGEIKPLVIPRQLRLAREALALSPQEVASASGISLEELHLWEEGTRTPPLEKLWVLAELYHRGVDYFLKASQPLPEQVNFRWAKPKHLRALSLESRAVLVQFEEFCRAVYELSGVLEEPRSILVERSPRELDPEHLASQERERLGLGDRPIKGLRNLLEKQGVLAFELRFPNNEIAGFSWWHREYGPSILVNAADVPGRRVFTLAHEYAHLIREESAYLCDPSNVDEKPDLTAISEEHSANRFATFFLMPASDVHSEFEARNLPKGSITAAQLGSFARRYEVSMEALGYRLEALGLLPKGITAQLISEWEGRPKHLRRPKLPSWRRQRGETYFSLALQAYKQGHISTGKLAQYLGLDVRDALRTLEKLGENR